MPPRQPPASILECSGLVLDFGCGHYRLQSAKARVIGVDHRIAGGADVLADFERSGSLPFRTGVFDGAYLSHVLEHMAEPVELLNEIRRVCRDDALVVVRVPHFSSPRAHEVFHRKYYGYFSLDPLATPGRLSAESQELFRISHRQFSMLPLPGLLNAWQRLGRVVATKAPWIYEALLYSVWPAYELIFEMRVIKSDGKTEM